MSWHYSVDGTQSDPVPWETLVSLVRGGQVKASDLIWTEGMADWAPASSIPGLFQPPPPPVLAPPAYAPSAAPSPAYPTPGTIAPVPTGDSIYAGLGLRFAAFLIDNILLGIVGVVSGFIPGAVMAAVGSPTQEELLLAGYLMGTVMGWLYYAILESSAWMATLGKKAAGIVVTDLHGHRISFGRATGRHFGKILSALPCMLGFFRIPFSEKQQGWHDELAKCLVLRDNALPSFDVSQTFE